jgi:AcrR family transcriptional regulator
VKSPATRTYVQRERARAAQANTERIMQAALELFVERPFDQITLGAVAERAGVGLQTVIRRIQTKDGLVRASGEWVATRIQESRGEPLAGDDPHAVAEAIARQYERWGALTDRTLRQEDASPALGEMAELGRMNHRAWIETTFAEHLDPLPAGARHALRARLVGVTGIELWQVLRRVEGLSVEQATTAVAELIAACLTTTHGRES